MTSSLPIAIVGGGFCGLMTAVRLLKSSSHSIVLIDPGANPGRGLAYQTSSPLHLLNVPAGQMSAYPEEPQSFVDWLVAKGLNFTEQSFVPRFIYGDYLEDQLRVALLDPKAAPRFRHLQAQVDQVSLKGPEELHLQLSNRTQLSASVVILALGNLPSRSLSFLSEVEIQSRFVVNDPWHNFGGQAIEKNSGPIVLIGSGLTAVDWIIEANRQGYRGKFVALSRHGFLPQSHKLRHADPPDFPPLACGDLRTSLRTFRVSLKAVRESGIDWRALFDSIRPKIQSYWIALSVFEQRQFLRHLRAYWDVHRHRIAPEVANQLTELRQSGRLEVRAGRVRQFQEQDDFFRLSVIPRGAVGEEWIEGKLLINCTGPGPAYLDSGGGNSLLRSLIDASLAAPDAHNFGIRTDAHSNVLNQSGIASRGLFAIGPLRKGELWESIAVPDLRVQCKELAEHIAVAYL